MKLTFKQYLQEMISVGDDNVLGGLLDTARKNLNALKTSFPKEKSLIDDILSGLDKIEQDPSMSMTDGYSVHQIVQKLTNPKIGISELRNLSDSLASGDGDNGE